MLVSVPSSLGHRVQRGKGIGQAGSKGKFQSPLHWGIAFNASNLGTRDRGGAVQSPLHLGIAFNTSPTAPSQSPAHGSRPLVIGACRATVHANATLLRCAAF